MSEKFFLSNLNYSMANEDTSVECSIAKSTKAARILSVCGSGSRALPLVNEFTKELDLIDLSELQLSFAGLRKYSYEKLTYEEFQEFWGYLEVPPELREKKYKKMIMDYQEELLSLFEEAGWSAPIYYGGWERTYKKLNFLVKLVVGEKLIAKLVASSNLKEQKKIFNKLSFRLRWTFVLIFVGNKTLFNTLLYKGHFVKKNIPGSYVQFYIKAFDRLMNLILIKDSYFLQISFLGEIKYPKGAPLEGQQETFETIKGNINNVKIQYVKGDIVSVLQKSESKYDLISLSDVPSYFDSTLGLEYLQKIKSSVNNGGHVIVRYYLKLHKPNLEGFTDVSKEYVRLIESEAVQMYDIKIYKRD